jgi:hypothetical protein
MQVMSSSSSRRGVKQVMTSLRLPTSTRRRCSPHLSRKTRLRPELSGDDDAQEAETLEEVED